MATWYPDASDELLEQMAVSLNQAFDHIVYANAENGELQITIASITLWMGADGTITGLASSGPHSDQQ